MRIDVRRITSTLAGIVSSAIGLALFFVFLNVIEMRMLRAGYLEGSGVSQAFRTMLGGPLVVLLAIGWLTLVILSFEYYYRGAKQGRLIRHFSLITAIEMFCLPLLIVLYQAAFPIGMLFSDWMFGICGAFLGGLGLYVYFDGWSNQEGQHA